VEEYLSEKEQWEAIKQWLRENGLWIVAGVAVGALILWGWRWYQDHVDQVGAQASTKYGKVLDAFVSGDRTQAFVLLGELEREYPSSPYVDQGKLALARAYVETNELDKAATELQAVADHSKDSELALIARLRLARVQIAQQKADAALATLNGPQPGAFDPRFHEIRGDAYYAKGDKAAALKEYLSARTGDFGSSPDTRELDLKISDLSADSTQAVKQAVSQAAMQKAPATAAASK
jgi:predicted negative regulator of RcsB-dependent stress response